LSIGIYYDNIKFRLRQTGNTKIFLEKVIREQKKIPGDLYFIFKDDRGLLDINRKFLNHNYYTDVISFDYSENKIISGEVYISIDTVKKNSKIYKVRFHEEVIRVMIHGTLHICGYDDTDEKSREEMFSLQEKLVKDFFKY
jgi:rRNA maturation RNase YbeY